MEKAICPTVSTPQFKWLPLREPKEAVPRGAEAAQFSVSLCCQVATAQPEGEMEAGQPSARGGAGSLSHKGSKLVRLYKTLSPLCTSSSFSGWMAGGFCCVKT